MLRFLLPLCLGILLTGSISAQRNYWTPVQDNQVVLPRGEEAPYLPATHATVALDLASMKDYLAQAPREFTAGSTEKALKIVLPMPDGRMEAFLIRETSNLHPDLEAKYPGIKSYLGTGIDHPSHVVRLGYTYKGFHAAVATPHGYVSIDPYVSTETQYYFSYHVGDLLESEELICGIEGDTYSQENPIEEMSFDFEQKEKSSLRGAGDPANIHLFSVALACTGEFADLVGGTVELVMSAYDVAMTRLNLIYGQEHSARFQLISRNDELIHLDKLLDPYVVVYNNPNDPNEGDNVLLGQNQNFLIDKLGVNAFDIGHVFTGRCREFGGVASLGGTCNPGSKGRGVTCFFSSNILFTVSGTMAHEIGHQFGASHSWDNCPGSDPQRASGTSFEPGSGSTIMSYSGACRDQNIPGGRFTNFHVASLTQVSNFIQRDPIQACADIIPTSNTKPNISLNYAEDMIIPINTPFRLTVEATDDEEDEMTYSWEQFDAYSDPTPLGSPVGNCPLFRSYPPSESPTRYFPGLDLVLNDNYIGNRFEYLPDYSRDLTFRVTVRDNNDEVGGVIWEQMAFKASATAGPFVVNSFSSSGQQVQGGDYIDIEWDVAGTDKMPVYCRRVNILLSEDGGNTFPHMLIEGAFNDGVQGVTIPSDIDTRDARIMVEATNNIFYHINKRDFTITPAMTASYALDVKAPFAKICLPDQASFELESSPILGYNDEIKLSVSGGLPVGAVATFSKDAIMPNESTTINIDLTDVIEQENIYTVEIMAVAPGQDTVFRYIQLDLIYNFFDDMLTLEPTNGLKDVADVPNLELKWQASEFADSYNFEFGTSPAFEANSILYTLNNTTATSFSIPDFLDKNTEYFWRVQAINRCGAQDYTNTSAFHTVTFDCKEFTSTDGPHNISGSGLPTVTSEIEVSSAGAISDLSVTQIQGYHAPVRFIDLILTSPKGTEVLLMTDLRCASQLFKLGFDDDATEAPPCPPNSDKLFKPEEPLSTLLGEDSEGKWKMSVKVVDQIGDGGEFTSWNLQFCSFTDPKDPVLINNDTLFVPPGLSNLIERPVLYAEDEDNSEEEILFTILNYPEHGELFKNGTLLAVGDIFTQADIDNSILRYRHDGSAELNDAFTFTIKDGEGGWFGTPTFNIKIDEDATVGLNDLEVSNPFQLFPNPASNLLNVEFAEAPNESYQLQIFNVQGQLIRQSRQSGAERQLQLNVQALSSGIYFLSIQNETTRLVKKFTISK